MYGKDEGKGLGREGGTQRAERTCRDHGKSGAATSCHLEQTRAPLFGMSFYPTVKRLWLFLGLCNVVGGVLPYSRSVRAVFIYIVFVLF